MLSGGIALELSELVRIRLIAYNYFSHIFGYFGTAYSLHDLSSPMNLDSCVEAWNPNCWTTRELPTFSYSILV